MIWWALNLVQGIFRGFVILVLDMQAQLKLETLTFVFLSIFLLLMLRNTFLATFLQVEMVARQKRRALLAKEVLMFSQI